MDVGFSMTDQPLEEEAQRYDLISHPKGKRVMGIPLLLSSNSNRAPEGESFDRPGGIEEESWGDKSTWLTVYEGNVENENGSWKLGEANKNRDKVRGEEGILVPLDLKIPKRRKRKYGGIKRREKIHSKELLEKSKFERELKRLECSVNYEGGNKQKGNQNSGDVGGYCEKSRHGEIYRLESLKCGGAAGGILICWDKRVLDIMDWEEGQFTLSCRFKIIENGAYWVFTGVYGPFTNVEREGMWEEFGAIRGLWDDPWCLGGDFNITLFQQERSSQRRISSAMRRFAETVDDLELVDLPLQGEEFTWNGGLIIRRGRD
ncbi:hypothetical protein CK203_049543 [Vitis vinifera]|uniref:Endonuclease/exonuclease/phosphatase domain-containing protein n=1 Tax=Vitis vinifera TaxID=29760 RepID=A0A438HBB1_VITVI|nr:hypothetical protein CK203_049543 [Vitis vinifera]